MNGEEPLSAVIDPIQHQHTECRKYTLKKYQHWWDYCLLHCFIEQVKSFFAGGSSRVLEGTVSLCLRRHWQVQNQTYWHLNLVGKPRHVFLVAWRILLHSGRNSESRNITPVVYLLGSTSRDYMFILDYPFLAYHLFLAGRNSSLAYHWAMYYISEMASAWLQMWVFQFFGIFFLLFFFFFFFSRYTAPIKIFPLLVLLAGGPWKGFSFLSFLLL